MQEWFQNLFAATLGLGDLGITVGLVVSVIVKIVIILIPLILTVAYLTYFERKVIGFMQLRVGPNVTGPRGLIQPFADVFKLLFKEVTRPKLSNKALFYIGPIMSLAPSFAAWAVIPFNEEWVLTNINIGLLYILMITSLSVYGVIIAGWASNSKYSFLGAMRVSVDSCNLPTLPLRPNHAFGLESADSDRLRLHRGFGRVDDFTAEFVEISFRRHLEAV